jgi:hypothetical protein
MNMRTVVGQHARGGMYWAGAVSIRALALITST